MLTIGTILKGLLAINHRHQQHTAGLLASCLQLTACRNMKIKISKSSTNIAARMHVLYNGVAALTPRWLSVVQGQQHIQSRGLAADNETNLSPWRNSNDADIKVCNSSVYLQWCKFTFRRKRAETRTRTSKTKLRVQCRLFIRFFPKGKH